MTALFKLATTAAATMLAASAFAQAQGGKVDFGKREYDANCASCHGTTGKGDGPVGAQLKKAPPDLTMLAKSNGGVFPIARLYDVIEGASVPAHGSRDMPIWGNEYRAQARKDYVDVEAPYDPEAYVRARLLLTLEYINRLQAK